MSRVTHSEPGLPMIRDHCSELRRIIHIRFFFSYSSFSTVAADPFTARLFDIYEKVWEQGNAHVSTMKLSNSLYLRLPRT